MVMFNGKTIGCNGDSFNQSSIEAMEVTGYKVFNDSVHGHITLHPLLVRVVDTPQFQRLRNLKQLGVANFVYPSAIHTRFEHSLGTCYLAGQMVEKLFSRDKARGRSDDEEKKLTLCVQLAALCHDLGHGALSHTWEAVTRSWGIQWRHEESSVSMFEHLVENNNLKPLFRDHKLEDKEMEIVKELILGGPKSVGNPTLEPCNNFLYEIVSNKETGIDVDKWDYFLRDGLHLNLRITFDYRRLLEFCTVLPSCDQIVDEKTKTHIAFRDKEMMNLYDMYRVRSALHHTAYRHRVVINIELMFIDAFKLADDAGYRINNSRDIYLKNVHKSAESMCEFTDHVYYDILYSRDGNLEKAQTILKRVLSRNLYKFVGKVPLKVPMENRQVFIKEKQSKLEEKLKELEIKQFSNVFRVGTFFLDLDVQNNQVSRVMFYQKVRGSNTIKEQTYENIKQLLDPFPFQLTNEPTALILVFCTVEGVKDNDLVEAKEIIDGL